MHLARYPRYSRVSCFPFSLTKLFTCKTKCTIYDNTLGTPPRCSRYIYASSREVITTTETKGIIIFPKRTTMST